MAFERHSKKYYAPRQPSGRRGATINGRPAWLVVQERREAALAALKENSNGH